MIKRVVAAMFLAWFALATYAFVVRPGDHPFRANAVVVLSGSNERLPVGLRLVRQGYAPLLVVSRSHDPNALERRTCARRTVLCFAAEPYSTRGEARMIARLARQRRWTRVDVVTSRFHVPRAKRMIERCYSGKLRVVAAPNPSPVWLARAYVLESVKLVYHELARGC